MVCAGFLGLILVACGDDSGSPGGANGDIAVTPAETATSSPEPTPEPLRHISSCREANPCPQGGYLYSGELITIPSGYVLTKFDWYDIGKTEQPGCTEEQDCEERTTYETWMDLTFENGCTINVNLDGQGLTIDDQKGACDEDVLRGIAYALRDAHRS